jgi:hypothetical protein
MRVRVVTLAAGLTGILGMLALVGCETGRVNKLHSGFESVSDVTTVPHPNPQYASIITEIPPVPGSPTAAGPNDLQPLDDNLARKDPGSEKGIPMAPRMQPKDSFLRQ